jgi:CrcB protein
MLTFGNLLAVAFGGMIGSVLRWLTAVWLNHLLPGLALGTLAVNMIGGFCIGLALAAFYNNPAWPVELRLLATAGFCGGFTTFSAFSSEVVMLMTEGRMEWAAATVLANVIGALLTTYAGMKAFQALM